ncbi:MAG TPA: dTDP-4-dehydrorhamnose reductase [Chitinophagaceae bacterium]|nr:dTDP-4-dehydrorhamnose reductase [Chitinophagaceae bacterium]
MATDNPIPYQGPELWGGIECTINRVNDRFFDQLKYSKHYDRDSDIHLLSQLGIKKIRYPVLWEKHQPQKDGLIDWTWIQQRLQSLQENNVEVIAGLLHHGSGPSYTNLMDEQFPSLLANYARQVAEKFPSLQYYTPVNEPLTTARFSGLYGLWYPHQVTSKSFITMLLNELKGTVLAMEEIKKVNPSAKLVQTEDLGKTYSTPKLKYQAKFENERRWLTYDLLMGKVDPTHALWKYFKRFRIPEKDLYFFQEHQCRPEILGFNHYVTSERYLDERTSLYPKNTIGGNGRHRYADVEVVRVDTPHKTGIEVLLEEAWDRYKHPIAITEVHLHSHREEQLRWFKHVWNAVKNVKSKGVDIRAVTAWAVFGSYGWNKLLTKPKGTYEPGVFDLRGKTVRPTALASYIKKLTSTENHKHPVTEDPGWWQRSSRVLFPANVISMDPLYHRYPSASPLLIIGKTGTLGRAFAKICHERSLPYIILGRGDCDIADSEQVNNVLDHYKPWAVVNTAGYVKVDEAETDSEACFRENLSGVQNLAIHCKQKGIKLLTYSTDLVFDGEKKKPYIESDAVNPLNVYGKSKAMCEAFLQSEYPSALIIRTSAFFGPWDEYNFMHYVLDNLSRQQQITVANDVVISPTYVPDLVHASLDLLIDDEQGIWHLTNKGSASWAELAFMTAGMANLDDKFINAVPSVQLSQPARRPAYTVLSSEKAIILPTLENAMKRFFHEKKIRLAAKSIV